MNNNRRKRIEACENTLKTIRDALEATSSTIEMLKDEEQDCMDNMPESLQSSMRYESMETAYDALEEALDSVTEAIDNLEEANERLEDARNVD